METEKEHDGWCDRREQGRRRREGKRDEAGTSRTSKIEGFGLRAAGYVLWVSSVGLKASGLGRGVAVRR